MKKKLGLLILAAVLLVTSTVTGTLAQQVDGAIPLTVADDTVQTSNPTVEIENIEYTGGKWLGGGDHLYPGTTLEKNFCVRNNGSEPVRVRTWFAFEADTTGFADLITLEQGADWTWEAKGQCTLNGVLYDLWVATYNGELAARQTTSVSLKTVAMNPAADNPQVTQFGTDYEIKVVSQAVGVPDGANNEVLNAAALETVFGTNHPFDN